MRHCDVLVIGAGPAGSAAAQAAALHGVQVEVLDRKRRAGIPVQCAGLVPQMFALECPIPPEVILHRLEGMITYLPSGENHVSQAPSFMLDRRAFDRELLRRALRAGAHLTLEARVIRIQKDHVIVSRRGREIGIGYKVLIGADGPMSSVARSCGLEQKEFLVTLQCTVPLRRESEYAEIIFLEELFGGYAWLFPRRMDAVVGVGLRRRPGQRLDLKKHLERILDRYTGSGMIEAKPLEWTSGLVPVSGPGIILRENVLLAGDAAGHTHPITGAGIAPAVVSGNLAGDLAAQYVLTGDPALLQQYEVFWKMRFQKELLRAVARRKLLESSWDDLSAVLCQCWPAFPGYYAKNN